MCIRDRRRRKPVKFCIHITVRHRLLPAEYINRILLRLRIHRNIGRDSRSRNDLMQNHGFRTFGKKPKLHADFHTAFCRCDAVHILLSLIHISSGNVSSQYLLARCYLEERGAKKDVVNGIKWYQAAARTRPDGEYDLKRNAIVQYAYAAANIADYMLVRDDRDPAQTFYWAQEAYNAHQAAISEMGGPASICFASILGNCYLFGIGTPVDYDRAIGYYRSADARYEFAAPAWAGLGRCSLYGLGMPKDLAQMCIRDRRC